MTTRTTNLNRYFLPYQIAWLLDDSKFKIWEKTRRGGMTYVQSYEDVRDAVAGRWDVWFSSADDTAAREYILYCERWAKLFNEAAKAFDETVLDDTGKPVTVKTITFANGRRINALTSSPSQFRSKGGKVVLDEFAWHRDQDALWAAAEPVTTWGFPLRIISTHNGMSCRFYKLLQDAAGIDAVVHTTTIYQAAEQGLVDKIYGRKTTEQERLDWLESKRKRVGPTVWDQEYCCKPIDESTAFLTYTIINGCSDPGILRTIDQLQHRFVLGMDIGRRRNLSVIWVAERLESRLITRIVNPMANTPFRSQYKTLSTYLSHPLFDHACIDKGGMGEQLAEDAQADFGSYRVEPVLFTNAIKSRIAETLKTSMEDRDFIIPSDGDNALVIREDFHSMKQVVTPAGNTRFDPSENEENPNSHADYFWAAALCRAAAGTASPEILGSIHLPEPRTDNRPDRSPRLDTLLDGYDRDLDTPLINLSQY
jgi:phage FluMu gp28-like protein